jgi:hypothetical protein
MNFKTMYRRSTGGTMPWTTYFYYKSHYTGGTYYEKEAMDMQGMLEIVEGTKQPMTVDDVMRWRGLGEIETFDFPRSAIANCKITDLKDGDRKMEFTLNGLGMSKPIFNKMKAMAGAWEFNEKTLTFNEAICEVVIDKNDMMKSYKMRYDVSIMSNEYENRLTNEITMTVNSYNDVKISFPSDLNSYELVK